MEENGEKWLFKMNRVVDYDKEMVNRISTIRANFELDIKNGCLLCPNIVKYKNRLVQKQRYIDGIPLLTLIRRYPYRYSIDKSFSSVTYLVEQLNGIKRTESNGHAQSGCVGTGIVHNDFGVANIIICSGRPYLIDWDGMAEGPRIYNVFEAIMHFCSLFTSSRYQKRSLRSYLTVFEKLEHGTLEGISERCVSLILSVSDTSSVVDIGELFCEFLHYKATATSTHLDDLWCSLLKHRNKIETDFVDWISHTSIQKHIANV